MGGVVVRDIALDEPAVQAAQIDPRCGLARYRLARERHIVAGDGDIAATVDVDAVRRCAGDREAGDHDIALARDREALRPARAATDGHALIRRESHARGRAGRASRVRARDDLHGVTRDCLRRGLGKCAERQRRRAGAGGGIRACCIRVVHDVGGGRGRRDTGQDRASQGQAEH